MISGAGILEEESVEKLVSILGIFIRVLLSGSRGALEIWVWIDSAEVSRLILSSPPSWVVADLKPFEAHTESIYRAKRPR